jgi:HptB-dependent secretion and biofilm anti anti-sigma factor
MSITTVLSTDDNSLTIAIKGRFDFASHQSFCDAYEGKDSEVVLYRIDMRDVSYLDSSALGMLLLLKDHAKDSAKISIVHCSDEVKKIFEISNFKQLFDID